MARCVVAVRVETSNRQCVGGRQCRSRDIAPRVIPSGELSGCAMRANDIGQTWRHFGSVSVSAISAVAKPSGETRCIACSIGEQTHGDT